MLHSPVVVMSLYRISAHDFWQTNDELFRVVRIQNCSEVECHYVFHRRCLRNIRDVTYSDRVTNDWRDPSSRLVQGSCRMLLQNEDSVWLGTCWRVVPLNYTSNRPARVAMTWTPLDGKQKIGCSLGPTASEGWWVATRPQTVGQTRPWVPTGLESGWSCRPAGRPVWLYQSDHLASGAWQSVPNGESYDVGVVSRNTLTLIPYVWRASVSTDRMQSQCIYPDRE